MVVVTSGLSLFLLTLLLEGSSGVGQAWLDGFQPPELDGAAVPPCEVVTVTPPLPTTAARRTASRTPPRPHPDPTLQSQAHALLKRDQLLSLLVLLLSNQRGAVHRPAQRTGVIGRRRHHGNAAVLPWWDMRGQKRGGARQQVRAGPVMALAWGPALRKASESSDSSEEFRM
ncbi:hypothetical protein ACEWY4_025125 [Coilia grayii]|uniref:Uncharacterized protein n=1 Tax=Coilia grayii TaxID=363190 RepID=A0ABD1IYG3_9TELE